MSLKLTAELIMSITDKPALTDVLLGRGVATNRHPGNENFRAIVSQHVDVYVTSAKKQKTMISRSIVNRVKTQLNPPGKFLEKNPNTGLWEEVGDKRALEKTAQALRDGAATLKKQLREDMSDPTFLDALFDEKGDASEKPSQNQSSPVSKKVKKSQQRKRAASMAKVVAKSDSSPSRSSKKQRLDPGIPAQYDQYDYAHPTHHIPYMYESHHQPAQPVHNMQARMLPPEQFVPPRHYPQMRTSHQEVRYGSMNHYAPLPVQSYREEIPEVTFLDGMLQVLEPLTYHDCFDLPQTTVIDDDSSGNSRAEECARYTVES